MQASVIIPVWNGETIIAECLEAIFKYATSSLEEVFCVDNASVDRSASIIATEFPQVRLLPQPVNLGFAGGVNQGIKSATGDVFVLLNQDCLVQENWLPALIEAFSSHPQYGILGGTIFDADGSVNHTGARLRQPDAFGIHETAISPDASPREVDYVTGAMLAIRRTAWDIIGPFDEAFYPAYFEEVDYCYRARHHGFQVVHVPEARATHKFTSRQWQKEPLQHTANQHRARYRFVAKHFRVEQLVDFFAAESAAVPTQVYHNQVLGRLLAARDVLHDLPAILAARQKDLEKDADSTRRRLLQVNFSHVQNDALKAAQSEMADRLRASREKLAELQEEKDTLLADIYFRDPHEPEPESGWQRWRLIVLRLASIFTLREHRLLVRLSTLHVAQFAQVQHHLQLLEQEARNHSNLLRTLATNEYG